MALENFWMHFPLSSRWMRPRAAVDSPRLDPDRIEEILSGSDFWLTQGSLKGYEPEDFAFLSEDERGRLSAGVEKYRPVSVKIRNGGGELTKDEFSQAKEGFLQVLQVIRPDKYADSVAFVLGKKIENRVRDQLPEWVREMVFETGVDSSGEPAIWIWVEVEDAAAEDRILGENFRRVREILIGAAASICPDRWPYVRLRTVSEQRPTAEPVRK